MFVRIEDIRSSLLENGFQVEEIERIPIGVMTDKFVFHSNGSNYVARCYPRTRGYLAEAEYKYMQLFLERGILCPKPVRCIDVGGNECLIYEYLEGRMLSDVYEKMSEEIKNTVCSEIAGNYIRISTIQCNGYGLMQGSEHFTYKNMREWGREVERNAENWIRQYGEQNIWAGCALDKFKKEIKEVRETQPVLVWSDLSMDNIIVDQKGSLVGFVDFEGLMGADVHLGIGYMQAHENNSDFAKRIISMMPDMDEKKIDVYALLRYMNILPYTHLDLPNGEKRENINQYLSYVRGNL